MLHSYSGLSEDHLFWFFKNKMYVLMHNKKTAPEKGLNLVQHQ